MGYSIGLNIIITLLCILAIIHEIESIMFDYRLGKAMYNEPFDAGRYISNIVFILLAICISVCAWSL